MRIGLITGEYPPDQGGVGDFSRELARSLMELGHEIHVITHVISSAQHATRKESRVSGSESQVAPIMHRVIESWSWGSWKQMLALAESSNLDVLNVQYQAAAYDMHPAINFAPRRRERPLIVVTFHDLKVPYLFPKAGPLRWWVVRMLARRANRAIVTNREDYHQLEKEIDPDTMSMIPIGSNIPPAPSPDYDRDAERARWGIASDDVLLGFFGFLNESKGAEELVEALALLVGRGLPVHLLMIGGRVGSSDPTNAAYAERVERLIADLGMKDRVHWSGYARPELVSGGLLAADICVLPYRDGVSFRRGTLHACMSHGRAVVTTQPAVPLPEIQDGDNMLLVEPRNPAALADAIARVAANLDLQERLETGAAVLAAEFTWERIARQTSALFRRMVHAA